MTEADDRAPSSRARPIATATFRLVLGAIAVLGMVLVAAFHLGGSLTVDEPLVANAVGLSWPELYRVFPHDDLPLHYAVMKLWASVFGDSEPALRSFSVLCFGAAIVTIGSAARAALGPAVGLTAALLLAVSNIAQFHATIARPYALLCLIVSAALWTVARLSRRANGTTVHVVALTVLHVLGLLTHPIYVFFLCTLPVAALWISRRTFTLVAVATLAASAAFLLLWWPVWRATLGMPTINWMTAPGLRDLGVALLSFWGPGKTALLVGSAVVLAVARPADVRRAVAAPMVPFAASVTALTIVVPFVVSQLHPVFNAGRSPIIALPAACIVLASILCAARERAVTLTVLAIVVAASVASAPRARVEELIPTRASVAAVAAAARCGDTLMLGSLSVGEVEYYWRRLQAPQCVARETFPRETQDHPAWLDVPGLLRRPHDVAAEAAAIAERLAGAPDATVWLFQNAADGYGHAVTAVLEAALDGRLHREDALPLKGSYFDVVVRYRVPSNTAR